MNKVKTALQPQFPSVGEESLVAMRKAVREALIEHHKAGQKVPTLREGKVVWVAVTESGEYADERY